MKSSICVNNMQDLLRDRLLERLDAEASTLGSCPISKITPIQPNNQNPCQMRKSHLGSPLNGLVTSGYIYTTRRLESCGIGPLPIYHQCRDISGGLPDHTPSSAAHRRPGQARGLRLLTGPLELEFFQLLEALVHGSELKTDPRPLRWIKPICNCRAFQTAPFGLGSCTQAVQP